MKILETILNVICIICAIIVGTGLVFYIAAALAVCSANDIWQQIDEWLHRR